MDKIKGWKTYIVGIAAILTAIGAYLNNIITLPNMVEAIFTAVATMTVRHGITTTITDATNKTP